ncbi:hypothetical protein WG901_18185 [Novosphingobium sp. PS1R-30]|uniref:HTH marR-type domain-containing protein n=1 Tax=Novosphingobium anseongense TaxID=3133436 RepID=A0ABU8RZT7_9SPHN
MQNGAELDPMKNPDFVTITLPASCPNAIHDRGACTCRADAPRTVPTDRSSTDPLQPNLAKLAKVLYASRAKRRKFLTAELLSEPAWDILLDLYINHAEGRSLRTTSVCLASNSPPTTALRWIGVLEQKRLIAREGSAQDQRAKDVRLTPRGVEAVEQCLMQYWIGLVEFMTEVLPARAIPLPLDQS